MFTQALMFICRGRWFDQTSAAIRYPQRWIGRGGSIPWFPSSPDIASTDFSLRLTVKEKVYQTQINTRRQLMQMIHIVFATVKRMNKKLVMQQILFSVDAGLRIRNNELHFEMKL